MGQRDRVKITPSFLRISRPGVDVSNPPSTTPEHLSMNSDWPSVERRYAIILMKNTDLDGQFKLNFAALDAPPLAIMLTRKLNTATLVDTKAHTSQYWQPSFLSPTGYVALDAIEDTHRIDWTSKTQVQVSQKPKTIRNPTAGSTSLTFDYTKYDFIVLIFKQGAS